MEQVKEKKDRLPILRQRLNDLLGDMSITDFAQMVGISRQTMGFYLNGDRIPDAVTLQQICAACNVSSDWLLGLSDVKSTDKNINIAKQYTGLTEENILFLDDPSSIFRNDEPLNDFRKSLYTLVNDLIFLCKDPDVYIPFWQIQRMLSIIGDTEIPSPGTSGNDLVAEGIAKKRGYAVLPVNDSIAFYAAQVGKAFETAIIERYSVTEKNIPCGISETISVNGKEITVYKE